MVCGKCMKIGGFAFLALGVLFLARDLTGWTFWNIQWWSALFIMWGIGSLASMNCPDCQAVRGEKSKGRKK